MNLLKFAMLIETLARLEHKQWVEWSKEIALTETISDERRKRWTTLWVDYDNLPESMKEEDRKWAKEVLSVILPLLQLSRRTTRTVSRAPLDPMTVKEGLDMFDLRKVHDPLSRSIIRRARA